MNRRQFLSRTFVATAGGILMPWGELWTPKTIVTHPGLRDDSIWIQALIDDHWRRGISEVVLQRGNYVIRNPIHCRKGVRLHGSGSTIYVKTTHAFESRSGPIRWVESLPQSFSAYFDVTAR